MLLSSLKVAILLVLHGFVIQAKSVLPEAVTFAVANSFNNTADLVQVAIETDFDKNTLSSLDTVDKLLGDNHWSFRYQIDVNNENGRIISDHNLWFVDSVEAFRRLLSWIGNYHRDSQLFFVIVLKLSNTCGHLNVIEEIFSDFLRLMIANVNLLTENASGEVSFYTFYPFQESSCRSAKPFKMYDFSENSIQNRNASLFPAKTNNFYGCPLRLRTRNFIILNVGYLEVYFVEAVIAAELASRLNFTYDIVKASTTDSVLLNENSSGPHQLLTNGEIDLVFGLYPNNVNNTLYLSKSVTYIMTHAVIAFQYLPDDIRNHVWLLIPFNSKAWICTFLFLAFISGGILYVKRCKSLLNVVQLEHVGLLEILAVSIGLSVRHLPRKNCLRFIFVVVSFGALVLRTAYLGELFNAYRGLGLDNHHRDFNQLLAENFIIYSHLYYASFIEELTTEMGNNRFVELDSVKNIRRIYDTDRKFAIFTMFLDFYSIFPYKDQDYKDWIFEIIFGEQFCIYFQQHSIIVPKINEIIEKLEESGILHHFRKNYDNIQNFGFSKKKFGHESLFKHNMPLFYEQFSCAFYLYIALNIFACLIFIMELLCKRL